MRMMMAGVPERRPHRSRLDHPSRPARQPRRGELAAGLAAVAVVAQCALAPVTLLVAGLLVLAGRVARWRLAWLLLPALGSACWLAVAGPPAAAHALVAGASRLVAADLAVALHPGRLLHPAAAFAGSGQWLPEELPLLLLAGTAEAAIVLWPHRTQRPGFVAELRRRAAAAALAAGHTVTASGFAIGVDGSGRLSGVSWAHAERGVLLTGGAPVELDQIGLAIACAAVRRRKAMLVLDLSEGGARHDYVSCGQRGGSGCAQVAGLAERVGVPVTRVGSVADRVPGASEAAAPSGARTSGGVSLDGAFGRAIRRRSVVLVSARHAVAAQSEAARSEPARSDSIPQALTELVGTLTSLRELGLRGDCLVWVAGCEAADPQRLSDLLSLGHATGTAVVLSTTSPELAADLAGVAGVVVASGPITGNLAQRLADIAVGSSAISRPSGPASVTGSASSSRAFADLLRRQCRGSATIIADGTLWGHGSFLTVPIAITEVR
jgi:hypothetical protein